MPTFQTLVASDREATPVNHSFLPQSNVDGVIQKWKVAGATKLGDRVFTLSTKTSGSKLKYRLTLKDPVVVTETINGVDQPKLARSAYADVSFSFDIESTEQERANAVGLMAAALGATRVAINDVIVVGEGTWS